LSHQITYLILGVFVKVNLLIQDLLDCPTVHSTLDFGGHLEGRLVLLFVYDARMVMRQRAQTMICVMVLNQRVMRHTPWRVIPAGLYEGQDSNALLLGHDEQSGLIQTLLDLQSGHDDLQLTFKGQRLAVSVLATADGKGRREGTGRSGANSMYPMTYNHLVKKRVKSLTVFAPITFKASTFKSLEPPPGLRGDALQVWARKHSGVCGRNFTRLDLDKLIPDILYQLLLTMNRCLNFTTKAIILSVIPTRSLRTGLVIFVSASELPTTPSGSTARVRARQS
jgi:hypothetical protein